MHEMAAKPWERDAQSRPCACVLMRIHDQFAIPVGGHLDHVGRAFEQTRPAAAAGHVNSVAGLRCHSCKGDADGSGR